MKRIVSAIILCMVFIIIQNVSSDDTQQATKSDMQTGPKTGLKLENLLHEKLGLVDGVEVILSRIVIPPNTELPLHYHDGEEFIYVIEGAAYMVLKDHPDTLLKAGDVYKVPLKQVHTAKTVDESATAVVFRVHEEGKPERVLVEK